MNDSQKYPIGRFVKPESISPADRAALLDRVRTTPAQVAELVGTIRPARVDTPYREGGWTARQVVHHVADSHMQAYGRTKLALTEENPVIKPYREAEWANLADRPRSPSKLPCASSVVYTCAGWRFSTV